MSSSGVNLQNYLIPLEEISRATENFSQQRCIGSGGFGAVYRGQLSEHWKNLTVAIKRLGKDSHQGEHEFRNELEMISKFHHENIICFIGYCDEGEEMIIVYEYATNGSLDHHLQDPSKMLCITWIERLMICIGAARGLNYLHSGLGEHNRVIHRDVKSSNILLDDNLIAKVCDFGLSKLGPRNQPDTQLHTRVAGTQFYLDPTYHESRILRKESDVYSFGVVLFEILSGMLVYHDRSTGNNEWQFLMNSVRQYYKKEPHNIIDHHIRDQIDSISFDIFQEIAYECISFNLVERPTMDKVIDRIEEALTIQIQSVLDKQSGRDDLSAGETRLLEKIMEDNRIAIRIYTHQLTIPHSRIQEEAIAAILIFSNSVDNKGIIVSFGAVPGIVHVLNVGSMEARENAAATISSLCVIDINKSIIGVEGAIPPLLFLLRIGTQKAKKEAITALLYLCLDQGNKGRAVRAGVVPVLIEILTEPQGVLKVETLSILAMLSSDPEGMLSIGKAEVVPVLVELIGSGSPNNKENAAAVLVELCSDNQNYLVEALVHGVMENLIDLLEHGTDMGKTKAKQLLEKIEDHCRAPGISNNDGNLKEHGADIEALMPKLCHSDYYTEPGIEELAARERAEPGFCGRVHNFTVGHHNYGSIKFPGETDVRRMELESLIQFNNREVMVYMDETKKPPIGQGLNKPAEVTLLNIKCFEKKTGKQLTEGPKIEKYRELLKKKAEDQGAEFVEYDPVKGEWKFRVKHFSRYGLQDDDDDDDVDGTVCF
ncbi:uncharacterized protein LOC111884591 [Lactuca sativa]|uniref:non-specific serine/threonine protein kinase n=1 Tax=Lactuca sativa TaxID=4236 RepID=A0A9R1XV70_LACSA|nr:uncharacterized protein LOC111884591 [Lactuca sativa]KAJ0226929.1 hypothetical protein LSAT_V11C100035440 [Lactuca sativa]